jgi:hypothetical protein
MVKSDLSRDEGKLRNTVDETSEKGNPDAFDPMQSNRGVCLSTVK